MGRGVQVRELDARIDVIGVGVDGGEEGLLRPGGVALCEVAAAELEEDIGVGFVGDGAEELVIDLGLVDEVVVVEMASEVPYQEGEGGYFVGDLWVGGVDALEVILRQLAPGYRISLGLTYQCFFGIVRRQTINGQPSPKILRQPKAIRRRITRRIVVLGHL